MSFARDNLLTANTKNIQKEEKDDQLKKVTEKKQFSNKVEFSYIQVFKNLGYNLNSDGGFPDEKEIPMAQESRGIQVIKKDIGHLGFNLNSDGAFDLLEDSPVITSPAKKLF